MNAKQAMKAIVFAWIIGICGISPAAILSPGDIVLASGGDYQQEGDGAIYKVDPVTGDRIIISGPGVGSGPGFEAFGIAVATHRDVYFSSFSSSPLANPSVYHLDVSSGNRQVIASPTVGTGPIVESPVGVVVREDGGLIVLDGSAGKVVLVDPTTLHRTTISGPGVGAGPSLSPTGIALGRDGSILVTNVFGIGGILTSTLVRIDPLTGDRETVSSDFLGNGPGPDLWFNVAVGDDGLVFVTNLQGSSQDRGVLSVDLSTGNREVVSANGTGVGPQLLQPLGIAVQGDGAILVSQFSSFDGNDLIRIDPVTGDRTLLSGSGVGSGPVLQNLGLLDVAPVPEPSSMILFISGVLLMLVARWQRVVSVDNALPGR